MFLSYPHLIASKKHGMYRLVTTGRASLPWRYGDTDAIGGIPCYVPATEEMPEELAKEIEQWPGPCVYFGRHCDSYPYARPLTDPFKEAIGLPFTDEEYAANAQKDKEARARLEDEDRRCKEFRDRVWA